MTRALPEHAVGVTLVKPSCNRGVAGCTPGANVCNFVATKARLGATLVRHGRNLRQKPSVTCVWPGCDRVRFGVTRVALGCCRCVTGVVVTLKGTGCTGYDPGRGAIPSVTRV
jgi:hypothetical protein